MSLDQHLPEDDRNGWTVYCPHRSCPAQEISGHGGTIKDAEKIIGQRRLNYKTNEEN